MESTLIPLMVVFPLLAAVVLNFIHGSRLVKHLMLACAILLIALPLIVSYGTHTFGGHSRIPFGSDLVPGIVYSYNPHQLVLIVALCLIAYLASSVYMHSSKTLSGVYLAFMLVGIAACAAIILSDDIFHMFVFLEIAVISQSALVIASGTLDSIKAVIKYLIVGNVCANLILLGIALLLSVAGSLNTTDIQNHLSKNPQLYLTPVVLLACSLLLFGWSYSAGLFPFHNIKSEMYAGAEPSAAALIQTQTKLILIAFAIMLLRIFGGVPHLRPLMLAISVGAMIFGVVMALRQDDYRRLLSYHAISQAGYVASGLSLGTPLAIAAGIFHAINNILFKSALFIGCDCVKYRSGATEFSKLGGALVSIPAVGFLVLSAKLAISGIPPFNGFQSKLMLIKASLAVGYPELAAIMILVSIGTFVSMIKAFHLIYLNHNEKAEVRTRHIPKTYVISLAVLVMLCILLGVYPDPLLKLIQPIADSIAGALPGGGV